MRMNNIIRILIIMYGSALIAPKETQLILDTISKSSKDQKKETKLKDDETKIEKFGLIRKTKKSLMNYTNKFWKWIY